MGDTYASLELAKLIKVQIPELWEKSISQFNKIQLEQVIAAKPFCYLESFFGKSKLFCLSFVGFHPKYKWALCFDLFEDPTLMYPDLSKCVGKINDNTNTQRMG